MPPTPGRSQIPRCASLAAGAQHPRARPPTPRPPTADHQAPAATARPGRLRQPPANLREHREPLGAAGIGAISQHRAFGIAEDARPQADTGWAIIGAPNGRLIQHQLPQAVRRHAVPVRRSGPGHRHAPRSGRRGDLLRQPGLPDPRLTRARHQAAAARQGIIQQQHDASQLAVTAHHRPRDPALRSPHQATIKPKDIGGLGVNSLDPTANAVVWPSCGRSH